jgi:hypothetical protein
LTPNIGVIFQQLDPSVDQRVLDLVAGGCPRVGDLTINVPAYPKVNF